MNHYSKIHIFLIGLVLIGAINWGLEAIDYNLVNYLSKSINKLLNGNWPIDKIIYIIVAIAGISLALKKETWLPFLGRTVIPTNVLDLKVPVKYDTKVKITIEPNTKVIYWAALGKNNPNQDVSVAYNNYENSGVALSDATGIVELLILAGDSYIVPPFGIMKPRHIHYRIVKSNNILGQVNTIEY